MCRRDSDHLTVSTTGTTIDTLSFQLADPPNRYPEWVVNSVPLTMRFGDAADGLVPPLVWWDAEQAAQCLLLEAPSDLATGRRSILVCDVCGDPSCGVISAVIERDSDVIVWRDF